MIPTLALATAGCLWGTGFFFGKIALLEMPVTTMVLYRFTFACLGLVAVLLWRRPNLRAIEWAWVWVAAVLGVPVQYLVQFQGLSLTTVSHASLMVGTLPILLAIASTLFSGERLDSYGWLALACATLGSGLIALSGRSALGAGGSLAGDLLVVLSMCAAIAWIMISKNLMRRHSALMVTALVFSLGTSLLAIIVLAAVGLPSLHYSRRAWTAVAEQGLLATACTTVLCNWGLKQVPASEAGVFVNLEPLVGAILGVFWLHEKLGPSALVGGALIIAGAGYFSSRPMSNDGPETPTCARLNAPRGRGGQ